MTTFYAQPYDISANGFYFSDEAEYTAKIVSILNDYGQIVEEFEIQFIDGELIDAELCKAVGINQCNILTIIEKLDEWSEDQKRMIIIAVGEMGAEFDFRNDCPYGLEVDIYDIDNLRELAEHFVDEGLFGAIPDHLQFYIDYDAIARDLAMDYSEIEIAGQRAIYRSS